ncbi:MAG: hypothetical protein ACYCR3_11400 [Acidithiobacillus sp.]
MPSPELLKAILVTAELLGTTVSPDAARVLADDLSVYPEPQVFAALTRCRRELRGKLTVAEILHRLDDGRPGAEEAWAMLPKSEAESVVWTEEMARAYGVAAMLRDHDEIAARMAFREAYLAAVSMARAERKAPKWTPSLGRDPEGRTAVLRDAVEKGRLKRDHVLRLVPPVAEVAALPADETIQSELQKFLSRGRPDDTARR